MSEHEDEGNSTDALADAYSNSLANIAAASSCTILGGGRRAFLLEASTSSMSLAGTSTATASAAVVSATPQNSTSSGEERDSSGCDAHPPHFCNQLSDINASNRMLDHRNAHRDDDDDRPHYHRHRNSSSSKHASANNNNSRKSQWKSGGESVKASWKRNNSTSNYNQSHGDSIGAAAAVVEAYRLPPLQMFLTSPAAPTASAKRYATSSVGGEKASRDQPSTTAAAATVMGDASSTTSISLLLQPPDREPCFHTIRQTFKKFVQRASRTVPLTSSNNDDNNNNNTSTSSKTSDFPNNSIEGDLGLVADKNNNKRIKRAPTGGKAKPVSTVASSALLLTKRLSLQHDGSNDDAMEYLEEEEDSGTSSGSGTEGGYGASNSSNGNVAQSSESCSSPSSEESSEESGNERKMSTTTADGDHHVRSMLRKKRESTMFSTSSDTADSSSTFKPLNAFKTGCRADSPSLTSSSNMDERHRRDPSNDRASVNRSSGRHMSSRNHRSSSGCWILSTSKNKTPRFPNETVSRKDSLRDDEISDFGRQRKRCRLEDRKPAAIVRNIQTTRNHSATTTLDGKPPILAIGCDVMAHVLTFLEPSDILEVLTMPLSKDWLATFTRQPELWRVLCLLEPFKAQVGDDEGIGESSGSSEKDSPTSPPVNAQLTTKTSTFRLLYTSYVRCMRCLIRIKDDAIHGRPLSIVDCAAVVVGKNNEPCNLSANHNLQQFLSRARGVAVPPPSTELIEAKCDAAPSTTTAYDKSSVMKKKKKRPRFGIFNHPYHHSTTHPTDIGDADLPWSCGIYSIVNWMLTFSDVEGIQTMCLRVLPFLLENEQQRITAQRAGLTDIVLRDMVLFPESAMLHTAAFHTIVLLARPLGGQEGMLFHTSMVNSSGIFSSNAEGVASGKSGIAVLLDSMRRFQSDEVLQSMACWSLVNIALAPSQKEVLVKLGGIEVISNAMREHQYVAEVQFRALFALINLVIPSVPRTIGENLGHLLSDDGTSEKEMLDDVVDEIVNLVVLSIRNFCSNEAILNRACLVLHNVSLTHSYHCAMLWTPNCYQMLEWCLRNYRTDQVLQQSAAGTLHRLQMTLSSDAALRQRFAASLQAQQKQSLEQAQREAKRLNEQNH